MKEYKHENVQLSFMAERSIQDEIQRESIADAYTVVIASLLMVNAVSAILNNTVI